MLHIPPTVYSAAAGLDEKDQQIWTKIESQNVQADSTILEQSVYPAM